MSTAHVIGLIMYINVRVC